jgi:hypothetical protein
MPEAAAGITMLASAEPPAVTANVAGDALPPLKVA